MSTTSSILSDTPNMGEVETTPPLGNNQAPAGIANSSETFTTIDPSSAIDFIKGKLTAEQIQDFWDDSIFDAIRASIILPNHPIRGPNISLGQVSKCWFSISFLDFLWGLLFGKTNGNSPWHHLPKELHLKMDEPNGNADSVFNPGVLIRAMNEKKTEAESLVRKELGESPIIVHMPKVVMPTVSQKRSEAQEMQDIVKEQRAKLLQRSYFNQQGGNHLPQASFVPESRPMPMNLESNYVVA